MTDDLETRRAALREQLGDHYAHERIHDHDYERRLEQLEAAGDEVDLAAVVADLPSFDEQGRRVITPYPAGHLSGAVLGGGAMVAASTGSALEERPAGALAQSDDAPLALSTSFGTVQRRGEWDAPRQIVANVSFGEGKLDFRQARMMPGVTEVIANVSLGALKITVSPELPVSCVGDAVMGEFSRYERSAEGLPDDAPRLRISGKVFMGEVKVIARQRPR
jgi:hypothetical protein